MNQCFICQKCGARQDVEEVKVEIKKGRKILKQWTAYLIDRKEHKKMMEECEELKKSLYLVSDKTKGKWAEAKVKQTLADNHRSIGAIWLFDAEGEKYANDSLILEREAANEVAKETYDYRVACNMADIAAVKFRGPVIEAVARKYGIGTRINWTEEGLVVGSLDKKEIYKY